MLDSAALLSVQRFEMGGRHRHLPAVNLWI